MRRRATGSCLLNLRGTEMSGRMSHCPGFLDGCLTVQGSWTETVQFSHDGIVRIRIILVLFAMWWTPQRHHDKRGNETKDYGLHLITMTFHFLLWIDVPIYRVTIPLYTLYYSLLYCLLCTFKTCNQPSSKQAAISQTILAQKTLEALTSLERKTSFRSKILWSIYANPLLGSNK